ncbi:MAG TPA: glycosyltransferase family 9 protein [Micromonosporaceae bacterium]
MILVLRALGVGDLATGVPALRGLRRAFPREELALAAPAWLAPLVELADAVDRLVPVDDLTPRPWTLAPPRLAVNLHGRGPQSHRLLASARPSRLLAFACPAAGFGDGPEWTFEEHEVARWCRLVAWYGVRVDPYDLRLRVPVARDVPTGTTVVHPGAKARERRWPPERFADVARALAADGHRVVVTGSANEEGLAAAVARSAGLDDGALLAGRTDAADLAALVAHARLVVCGDTGVGHLATAYEVPSVILFGPMPPRLWGPPDRPWHVALWPGPGGRSDPALLRISAADVLAAADAALAAAPERVRAR